MPDSHEPITPALSADEWAEFGASKAFFERLATGGRPFGPNRRFTDDQKLHALAALALHRHPAVFTHAELDAIEAASQLFERRRGLGDLALASALRSAHQKIAALIPPAGTRIVAPE
jgi:hypothetical protein